MKNLFLTIAIIGASIYSSPIFSQGQVKDSLGLPGDNLNLYAVLDVFQQSKTLEEFEAKLNSKDSRINNLDLNGDNKIDYIKVVDNGKGNLHAIVLKDEVNEHDLQDVAVIEVNKDNTGKIIIQVVGDEQLYGKNYIVEPKDQDNSSTSTSTPNPGYKGQSSETTIINNYYDDDDYYRNNTYGREGYYYGGRHIVYYPVNTWYMWDYLYAPTYSFYVSPWNWGFYPSYWNPWTPFYWHEYYGFHYHNYGYFHRCNDYRSPEAHGYYGPRRSVSKAVIQRNYSGSYNTTYGRRDLLNKTVSERHNQEIRDRQNRNEGPTRENGRNERQDGVQDRNTVPRNEERNSENIHRVENNQDRTSPRNDNRGTERQQRIDNRQDRKSAPRNENRQQPNSAPRNENKVNRQESNNRPAPSQRQTRTERRAERASSHAAPGGNNGGGRK